VICPTPGRKNTGKSCCARNQRTDCDLGRAKYTGSRQPPYPAFKPYTGPGNLKPCRTLVIDPKRIYLNTNEHLRAKFDVETREMRFLKKCLADYPLHHYDDWRLSCIRFGPSIADGDSSEFKKACHITGQSISQAFVLYFGQVFGNLRLSRNSSMNF